MTTAPTGTIVAVDTNLLLRRLLDDDPDQSRKAHAFFSRHRRVLITDIVLAETAWTLTGRRYRASRDDIADTVLALYQNPSICFEDESVVWAALSDFIDSESADFADAMIVNKSKSLGAESVFNFDSGAQAMSGVLNPL